MQMKLIKKSLLFLFLTAASLAGSMLHAQRTLVEVAIDSSAILIGEQTTLHLTVAASPDKPVQLLFPTDTLMRGVEVLAYSAPDSSIIDNRLQIKMDVLVTSFDSALYLLPPFKVVDGVDTIYSNQVALKVSTVPVDVDQPDQFYDIKPVWKPPFVLADYYLLIYAVLFTLFLICVIAYIIQRLRNKQSILPFGKPEVKLPPHQQAFRELDDIKQKKLWQQGRNKEYYTLLTDTLRRYMTDRFGIAAMEMTSGEILDIIRRENDAESVYASLKQILQISDLVKFAKWQPLPDENDLSMMNAYLFVNQTKIEEMPTAGELTEQESADTDGKAVGNSTKDQALNRE